MKKRWVLLDENGKDLRETLIKNRKIQDTGTFFGPHLYKLTSPDKFFPDLQRAVERIKKAIKNKELIYIYGDFDVDGITASAIAWETIDFLGGEVLPYIPDRDKEGYGLHADVLKKLAKEGAKVVISVDCGITAVKETEVAKNLGADLIITDHHIAGEKTPKPFALLHTEKLAGSGVAFMLAKALLESFGQEAGGQFYKNLELATIGTIADMVPLLEDNRIIVANGLANLWKTNRIGLKALYEEAVLTKKIGTYEIGFMIAPRLNAAGRMEHALDSLRLLLTRDKERARQLAVKLSAVNKARQEATASALDHARGVVNGNGAAKIIVVHHETYPQGVIGLVAGRLAEEHYRPTIVISEISPISKGSGRSIAGFNITHAISSAKKHLISVGGHPMAAGFSIEKPKIPYFKEEMMKFAQEHLKSSDLVPNLKIDTTLAPKSLNSETLGVLKEFEPFGIGNPEPVFLTRNLQVVNIRRLGHEGKHLRLVLRGDGANVYDAIGFGFGDQNVKIGDRVDVVYNLREDHWNGRKKLELRIKDFRPSEKN